MIIGSINYSGLLCNLICSTRITLFWKYGCSLNAFRLNYFLVLQNYTSFWQSVFSLTDCTWHDVTLNITFTRASASCKSDFLATFALTPHFFDQQSTHCTVHSLGSMVLVPLLISLCWPGISRPWFAQVNPTSGSELRLQLPAATSSSRICVRSVACLGFCRFHQCKKPDSRSI